MAGNKTKGGRSLNPADAFRKEQRKKEVARNKLERKFIRGAGALKSKPEELKKELQEIIEVEENGTLSKALKLRKKAVQEAYDQAIKRKKVCQSACARQSHSSRRMHPTSAGAWRSGLSGLRKCTCAACPPCMLQHASVLAALAARVVGMHATHGHVEAGRPSLASARHRALQLAHVATTARFGC